METDHESNDDESEVDSDDDVAPLLDDHTQSEDEPPNDEEEDDGDAKADYPGLSWAQWNIGDPQPSFKKFLSDKTRVGFHCPEEINTPLDFFLFLFAFRC